MEEEEALDPRIKSELDSLNQSTVQINSVETELTEERNMFKMSLNNAIEQLTKLSKKYGKSIERARPYYVTKAQATQAQLALQRAVSNFQRANGVYRAAKETIALAETRLREFDEKKVDAAWQEMLNMQTLRFMEAEKDRTRSERLHEQAAKRYEFLDKKLQHIAKKHRKSTSKAKPYFELKEHLEAELQKKRIKVEELQKEVDGAKKQYKEALENLERISCEIHEKRKARDAAASNPLDNVQIRRPTIGESDEADYEAECDSIMRNAGINISLSKTNCDEIPSLEFTLKRMTSLSSQDCTSSDESDDEISANEVPLSPTAESSVKIDEMNSLNAGEGSQEGTAEWNKVEDATYRRLHGTTVCPPETEGSASATNNFDIFDDLC